MDSQEASVHKYETRIGVEKWGYPKSISNPFSVDGVLQDCRVDTKVPVIRDHVTVEGEQCRKQVPFV